MFTPTVALAILAVSGASASVLQARQAPASAIVEFTFPATRGESPSDNSVGPCGGVTTTSPVDFPVSGGSLALTLVRDVHNLQINYAPTSTWSDWSTYNPLLPNTTYMWSGTQCNRAPNFASLGFAAGDQLTLSVVSQTGPSRVNVYNCADIRLVEASSYVDPDFNCTNTIRSFQTRRDGTSFDPSSGQLVSPVREDTGLSDAEAGAVGAGVTLGLVGIAGLALFFLGYVSFGKKSRASKITDDDHSSGHSVMVQKQHQRV